MAKKSELKFEDKINRLESIVSELEKDNVNLDKSLDLYKEGLSLSKELKIELKEFENKINELSEEDNE